MHIRQGWRRRGSRGLMLAGLIALLLAACSGGGGGNSNAAGGSPIVIGEDAELSGSFATLGTGSTYGATAYADMINKQGGVLGHKIKLVKVDNTSSASTSAAVMRKLVQQDGANFLIGAGVSADAAAAIPVADSLQTPYIAWDGGGWPVPGVTQAESHSWAFNATDAVPSAAISTVIQEVILPLKIKKVALIEDNTPFGVEYKPELQQAAKQFGFTLTTTQIATAGAVSDSAQVVNMLATKPQLIFDGLTAGADTLVGIKSIRAQSTTIPIAGCLSCTIPSFTSAVGGASAMQNVYSIASIPQLATALPKTTRNQETIGEVNQYLRAMKAAGLTSEDELTTGQTGWESMLELVTAIKTAGSVQGSAVRNALEHQKLDSLGVFYERTPNDYGAYDHNASIEGIELTKPDGSFVPYIPKS